MRKPDLVVLCLWLVAAWLGIAPAAAQTDIPYGRDPDQTLDLYHPPGAAPAPLVVFLHGGGWTGGSKNTARKIAPTLVQRGYAVASLNYRLSPQTDPAGAVQDTAAGIAYLLHNAARFGLRADRFAIMGHSSGAHMVALLGTDAHYLQRAGVDPASLAAVMTLDGVFDVHANLTNYPSEKRAGVFGNDPAKWKTVSPVALLDGMKTHPRFCVLHEDRNPRFVEQAQLFETALKGHRETVETALAPGFTHGGLVRQFDDLSAPMAPFVLGCLRETLGGS